LMEEIRTTQQGQAVGRRLPGIAPKGTDLHAEGTAETGNVLADPTEAKDTDRPAGEFRPYRRRRDSDRPLALPVSVSQRTIEPQKLAGHCEDRSEHVFGDTGLMTIGFGEQCTAEQG